MQPVIDQTNNTLGSRIELLMNEHGINQIELAEKVDVSQGTISRIIDGKFKKSKYLPAIAKVLNTTPEYLKHGTIDQKYAEKTSPSNFRIKEHDFMLISMYHIDAENSKDNEEVLMLDKSMVPSGYNTENLRFINQSDDAMSPKITRNSKVAFSMDHKNVIQGLAYVIKNGVLPAQARLLYPLANGGLRVSGTPEQQQYFQDEFISKEDLDNGTFVVLGKVFSVTTLWD
nr:helix-turn-helix domain-containing protein [uncultured Acinetobacter sp.]